MRTLPFFALLVVCCLHFGTASAQVTNRPYVEERYTRSVLITRVELTSRYTIIDMQYGEPGVRPLFRLPGMMGGGQIGIDPRSRLYKPGVASRRYKFIKAEGIPVSPAYHRVIPGEVVSFRLYYERLDPGIEIFDFYEGRNPDQTEYWNFYGIHIKNPLRRKSLPKPSAPEQKPAEAPREEPKVEEPPLSQLPDEAPAPADVPQAPEMVSLMGGVYDAQTRKPIPAQLMYVEQGDSMRIATSSGRYRLSLNARQRYSLGAGAKGYLNSRVVISPADSTGKGVLNHNFYLAPLTEGTSVLLNNIYFTTGEYKLLAESYEELNGLVDMLRENPSLKIRIEGHTDNLGDFDKNVELSRNRANAVRDYLIEKGISANRLEAKGYGSTRPVSRGNSEAERQKNRRVEFVIVQV